MPFVPTQHPRDKQGKFVDVEKELKAMGGTWDAATGDWIIPAAAAPKLKQLIEKIKLKPDGPPKQSTAVQIAPGAVPLTGSQRKRLVELDAAGDKGLTPTTDQAKTPMQYFVVAGLASTEDGKTFKITGEGSKRAATVAGGSAPGPGPGAPEAGSATPHIDAVLGPLKQPGVALGGSTAEPLPAVPNKVGGDPLLYGPSGKPRNFKAMSATKLKEVVDKTDASLKDDPAYKAAKAEYEKKAGPGVTLGGPSGSDLKKQALEKAPPGSVIVFDVGKGPQSGTVIQETSNGIGVELEGEEGVFGPGLKVTVKPSIILSGQTEVVSTPGGTAGAEEALGGAVDPESPSVQAWIEDGSTINGLLRGASPDEEVIKEFPLQHGSLEDTVAMVEADMSPIGQPITVYRGTPEPPADGVDPAFIATSIDPDLAGAFGDHLMEIQVPAGVSVLNLMDENEQQEIVLQRGLSFKKVGTGRAPNGKPLTKYEVTAAPAAIPGAVPPQPQQAKGVPSTLDGLSFSKKLGGTTGAGMWTDSQGNKFVVKKGADGGHVREEALSDAIYQALGVNVPEHKLDKDENGQPAKIAKFIEGTQMNQLEPMKKDIARKQLQAGFWADAWLANWDVTGTDDDNTLVDADGTVWRIDNGGSLRYRAMGAKKGSAFGLEVTELDSMRGKGGPSPLPSTKAAFGGLSDAEVAEQVLTNATDERLEQVFAAIDNSALSKEDRGELKLTLESRMHSMRKWAKEHAGPEPDPSKPDLGLPPKGRGKIKKGSIVTVDKIPVGAAFVDDEDLGLTWEKTGEPNQVKALTSSEELSISDGDIADLDVDGEGLQFEILSMPGEPVGSVKHPAALPQPGDIMKIADMPVGTVFNDPWGEDAIWEKQADQIEPVSKSPDAAISDKPIPLSFLQDAGVNDQAVVVDPLALAPGPSAGLGDWEPFDGAKLTGGGGSGEIFTVSDTGGTFMDVKDSSGTVVASYTFDELKQAVANGAWTPIDGVPPSPDIADEIKAAAAANAGAVGPGPIAEGDAATFDDMPVGTVFQVEGALWEKIDSKTSRAKSVPAKYAWEEGDSTTVWSSDSQATFTVNSLPQVAPAQPGESPPIGTEDLVPSPAVSPAAIGATKKLPKNAKQTNNLQASPSGAPSPAKLADLDLMVGDKVQMKDSPGSPYLEIVAIHPNGMVTVKQKLAAGGFKGLPKYAKPAKVIKADQTPLKLKGASTAAPVAPSAPTKTVDQLQKGDLVKVEPPAGPQHAQVGLFSHIDEGGTLHYYSTHGGSMRSAPKDKASVPAPGETATTPPVGLYPKTGKNAKQAPTKPNGQTAQMQELQLAPGDQVFFGAGSPSMTLVKQYPHGGWEGTTKSGGIKNTFAAKPVTGVIKADGSKLQLKDPLGIGVNVAAPSTVTAVDILPKLTPGRPGTTIGSIPNGTVVGTPDGKVGIKNDALPASGGYTAFEDTATGKKFSVKSTLTPTKMSEDEGLKQLAKSLLAKNKAAAPAKAAAAQTAAQQAKAATTAEQIPGAPQKFAGVPSNAAAANKIKSWQSDNASKLDSKHKSAVKSYTNGGYSGINEALRSSTGKKTLAQAQKIKALDEAIAVASPFQEPVLLSRKTTVSQWATVEAGDVIQDNGFLSTSTSQGTWSGNIQLKILAPKGTKGLWVNTTGGSSHPGESEVILPRGTQFHILKREGSILWVEIIP